MTQEPRASRRAALAGAGTLVAATAGALSGCAASAPKVRNLPAPAKEGDVQLIGRALALERRTIDAYTAGIPLLHRRHARVAKLFLLHELQHSGELIRLLGELDVKPPPRAASYDIGHPRSDQEVLVLLHELENLQLTLYLDLIPRLSAGRVRSGVASILGSDAQHISLLRQELRAPPAPEALVTGRE